MYKLPKIFSIFQLNMLLNYSLSLIPKQIRKLYTWVGQKNLLTLTLTNICAFILRHSSKGMNIFISCFRKVWFSKCQYKEYYNKFFKQFRSLRKYFFIDSLNMGVLFWGQKSILIFYQCMQLWCTCNYYYFLLFFFYWITNKPPPHKEKQMKKEK